MNDLFLSSVYETILRYFFSLLSLLEIKFLLHASLFLCFDDAFQNFDQSRIWRILFNIHNLQLQ